MVCAGHSAALGQYLAHSRHTIGSCTKKEESEKFVLLVLSSLLPGKLTQISNMFLRVWNPGVHN